MAKYDALRKVDAGMVRAYAEAHPELSYQEVADKFKISRQRVAQLAPRSGRDRVGGGGGPPK